MLFFATDSSGVGVACRDGLQRWAHWPKSAWFQAWKDSAKEQARTLQSCRVGQDAALCTRPVSLC